MDKNGFIIEKYLTFTTIVYAENEEAAMEMAKRLDRCGVEEIPEMQRRGEWEREYKTVTRCKRENHTAFLRTRNA